MRSAAIDVGTNTVRYLIAENGINFRAIEEGGRVTALGENLNETGTLQDEAMNRTLLAIEEYAAYACNHDARNIVAFATSAVRDASNGRTFAESVQSKISVPLHVLTGDDEARLTFLGASKGLELGEKTALVFDLGGGSTEFIYGREERIEKAISVDVGSRRQTALFKVIHPVLAGVREEIENSISNATPDFVRSLARDVPIVGVGGTVTTLAAIAQRLNRYDPQRVHGFVLRSNQLESLIDKLGASTIDELQKIPSLEAGRAETLYAGTAIVCGILKATSHDSLTVSARGILWGAILGAMMDGWRPL